jgi:hypothetical protein
MDENGKPSRMDLQIAARKLGALISQVGDFYDVAEDIARGYADYHAGNDTSPERRLPLQLSALNELQSVANNVIEWRVDDARDAYLSWEKIGDALDISRQAAQQKYGAKK